MKKNEDQQIADDSEAQKKELEEKIKSDILRLKQLEALEEIRKQFKKTVNIDGGIGLLDSLMGMIEEEEDLSKTKKL
jgi:hypothetical protein